MSVRGDVTRVGFIAPSEGGGSRLETFCTSSRATSPMVIRRERCKTYFLAYYFHLGDFLAKKKYFGASGISLKFFLNLRKKY